MTRLLAATLVAAAATAASAEPVAVTADRCASVDAAALTGAVGRELALDPADVAAQAPLAVEIACPDGVHAHVAIASAAGDGGLARDLDLSEEPAALQTKLVALAIAELVEQLRAERAPHVVAPVAKLADDEVPVFVHTRAAPLAAPLGVTVRAGVRMIVGGTAMPTLSADVDAGVVRVGLAAAIGDGDGDGDGHHIDGGRRDTGMPYFVALVVGRDIACSRGATAMCVVARGEAGFEGTSPHADDHDVMPRAAYATYADLELGVEARRRIAGWIWVAGVDLGLGDGLVVESAALERLDGPFAVATLGTSW